MVFNNVSSIQKRKVGSDENRGTHFHERCHVTFKVDDLEQSLEDSNKKILTSFLENQRKGSNWTLDKIIGHTVNECRKVQTFTRIKFHSATVYQSN